MIRRFTYLLVGFTVCALLSGCQEETSSSGQVTRNVAAKPPVQKVAPAEVKAEEKKEPEFEYVSKGRRDPFVPLTAIKRPLAVQSDEPATPLQTYDVAQYRLVGVIVGKGDPKAMVVAPDGKSYVLAKGVKIGKNNGVIKDITGDVIQVEEKYYDFSGNVITNIQEISVPKREGI